MATTTEQTQTELLRVLTNMTNLLEALDDEVGRLRERVAELEDKGKTK